MRARPFTSWSIDGIGGQNRTFFDSMMCDRQLTNIAKQLNNIAKRFVFEAQVKMRFARSFKKQKEKFELSY